MKCTIPGPNIKIFGRAIHSLSKIGDELYMEPMDDNLAIRTVNSSRSAYACFSFKTRFFTNYVPTAVVQNTQGEEDEAVRCKITMKSCLTVFKSLSNLDKTVEKCRIHLDMKEARLVFQLYCKHGIVKTHNLSFIECETLQAVFSKDLLPNCLTAQSRLFLDAVVNFQNNQEEITLNVNPAKVTIRNYVDDEPDPNKCIRSELALDPDEFEEYQIGVDTEVTFCLKEFRAILAFSEPANLPLTTHFEGAGKPIVLSIDGDAGYEGDFVLATLAETSNDASQPSTQSRNTTSHISTIKTPKPANQRRPNVPKVSARKDIQSSASTSRMETSSRREEQSRASTSNGVERNGNKSQTVATHHERQSSPEETSPVIPTCADRTLQKSNLLAPAMEDSDETDDEMLPGTPPNKKFKSFFFGITSQSTQGSQKPKPASDTPRVLAADTDDEDD